MRLLYTVLLLGWFSYVYSETCPPPLSIYPCICEDFETYLDISCEQTSLEDLKNSLQSLSGKNDIYMNLQNIDFGTMPSDLFSGIGVENLLISECKLGNFTGDDKGPAFSGLEDSLEYLTIAESIFQVNGQPKLAFGHLKKLRSLFLTSNTISELSNDWFDEGQSSLVTIILTRNGIQKLADRAFANLKNLKHLFLTENQFGSISRSVLPSPAEQLASLDLRNNRLTSLPEDMFSSMPSLNHLLLNDNELSRLDQSTWEPVWEQLDYIHLEGNPLHCDSHMSWMFNLRMSPFIHGTCSSPPEMKGTALRTFIYNKGKTDITM